jgi:hypothetical protein
LFFPPWDSRIRAQPAIFAVPLDGLMIMFAIYSLQSTLIAEPVKFVDDLGIKPAG